MRVCRAWRSTTSTGGAHMAHRQGQVVVAALEAGGQVPRKPGVQISAHLLTHRGLSLVQLPGGAVEAVQVHHGDEGAQQLGAEIGGGHRSLAMNSKRRKYHWND